MLCTNVSRAPCMAAGKVMRIARPRALLARAGCRAQQQQQEAGPSTLDGPSTSQPAHEFLATHLLQHHSLAVPSTVLLAGAALLCMLPVDPAHAGDLQHLHHAASAQFDLAENEDFWGNVARYGRYFVTVMLGTGYVMVKPLLNAFKNPVSGVLAVSAIVALVFGIKVTLELMLGLSSGFDYQIEQ